MPYIRLTSVVKSFGGIEIIHGVDLEIEEHEFTVFVGPSGCGKSTLLRLIAGLEDLTSGSISIAGERVDQLQPTERGVAMVFQTYALFPHMTVFGNMAFGLRIAKVAKLEIRARVETAAEILQITDILDRHPRALSGGQRQRVAIGRAIVRDPKVFLFDEPLSNLDARLRVQMRVELTKLHKELNATMIYVTHDQVEAMTMADRIVVLNQGRVEQVGRPLDLYHHPKNIFVAGFIGSPAMNFMQAKILEISDFGVEVETSGGYRSQVRCRPTKSASVGASVTLGVRPEALVAGTGGDDANIPTWVQTVERLGGETYLYTQTGNGTQITVRAPGDIVVSMGDEITIGFVPEDCHLFEEGGRAFERVRA